MIDARVVLHNGVKIPVLGFGVFQIARKDTERVVRSALDIGYRLVDTAALYGNEQEVGRAIRHSGVPREDVFVTTKLRPLRFLGVEKAFYASLKRLNLDYVDLYLIHRPFWRKREVWNVFETLYSKGLVKAIGVSNYRVKDIEAITKAASITPTVNQVEFHPFLYRKEILEYCASKNIVVEAHSPLTHGKRIGDPRIRTVAEHYQKSPAQILIRWALQHGTVVIPKSIHEKRLRENADVFDFEINLQDMRILDELDEDYHVARISRRVGDA